MTTSTTALPLFDWLSTPQRSDLMQITRAVRAGAEIPPGLRPFVLGFCRRGLYGSDRLRRRAVEALQSLGELSADDAGHRTEERRPARRLARGGGHWK